MNQYFIIADNTIKFNNGKNIIDERLIYAGEGFWYRDFEKAFKYPDATAAITEAKKLNIENSVKVYIVNRNGPAVNVAEVQF